MVFKYLFAKNLKNPQHSLVGYFVVVSEYAFLFFKNYLLYITCLDFVSCTVYTEESLFVFVFHAIHFFKYMFY